MAKVLVIGAGCAGLAAAARLAAGGVEPVVLEARERAGGRVATIRVPGLATAIELGAEFVHGEGEHTLALARRAGIPLVDVGGRPASFADGAPRDDVRSVARLALLLERMDRNAPVERTFAEELARVGDGVDPVDRERLLEYVRGYHAADPLRASARSILTSELDEEPGSHRQMRPVGGQGAFVEALVRELPAGALRLGHRVEAVEWRAGAVRVRGARAGGGAFEEGAPAAVIALPAALLQAEPEAGGIAFAPRLEAKRAPLAGLGTGSVLRATFLFDAPFWEPVAYGMGFLRIPGPNAPVWWTARPSADPVLVAWAGGTQTRPNLANAERADRALSDLARHLGVSEPEVRRRVVSSWTHDWDADPFARGAYTYPLAGVEAPWRGLAEPIAATLFFAGEATQVHGRLGTVEGALGSGVRAANEALAGASKRGRSSTTNQPHPRV
jgi:monoamine oxidase